jgi:hypothetical protein
MSLFYGDNKESDGKPCLYCRMEIIGPPPSAPSGFCSIQCADAVALEHLNELEGFKSVVLKAAENKELVAQFDRLAGTNLGGKGTSLDLMIDEATGRLEHDVQEFVTFVHDAIWMRLER